MPIKGLTENVRFTRGGRLAIGTKKVSEKGNEYPAKLDHFEAQFEDDAIGKAFHDLYGSHPTQVRIALASDDLDIAFPHYYKAYGAAAGLKCRGDGETAERVNDKGEMFEVECPGPADCPYGQEHKCKPVGTLQFFIQGLDTMCVFEVRTSSWNSIRNINSGIQLLRTLRQGKSIAGIWLDLHLVAQTVQHDNKQSTAYILKLHIPGNPSNVHKLASVFDVPAALPEPKPVSERAAPIDVASEEAVPDPEFGEETDTDIPPRDTMLEALGNYCKQKCLAKGDVAKAILHKHGQAKFDDLTDRMILESINELGIVIDDIPF